jgi:NADPH-dependent 2,4-dienoyl-CoA reductase/sulfur reductase-like enzyme
MLLTRRYARHRTDPDPRCSPQGLAALEARLRQDLQWLALPGKSWTPATVRDGVPVIDVAIIGGGQAGMAASVALSHLGIPNVIYDQSPKDFEGPWPPLRAWKPCVPPRP